MTSRCDNYLVFGPLALYTLQVRAFYDSVQVRSHRDLSDLFIVGGLSPGNVRGIFALSLADFFVVFPSLILSGFNIGQESLSRVDRYLLVLL